MIPVHTNMGDISGLYDDFDHRDMQHQRNSLSKQTHIIKMIESGNFNETDCLLLNFRISVTSIRAIWSGIKDRYQNLPDNVPVINRYIRDLIMVDLGLDIDMRGKSKDPLCSHDIAEQIIELNPFVLCEKEQFWLRCRAQGMSLAQIKNSTIQQFADDPDIGGIERCTISRFLDSVRKQVLGVNLNKTIYNIKLTVPEK